jgi:hypothetical protein
VLGTLAFPEQIKCDFRCFGFQFLKIRRKQFCLPLNLAFLSSRYFYTNYTPESRAGGEQSGEKPLEVGNAYSWCRVSLGPVRPGLGVERKGERKVSDIKTIKSNTFKEI